MARTACLLCLISTEVAAATKEAKRCSAGSRHTTKLEQSISLDIYDAFKPKSKWSLRTNHRYQKSKIDSFRFVVCLLLAPVFQGFFFVVAINSANEANKAGGTHL
jgi:hypothetical protein